MRLKNITIENFRSIKGPIHIPLDASIVLIHGPNGAGKTSVLTALEMALTGSSNALSRIDSEYQNYLLHKGAQSGKITLTASNFERESAEILLNSAGGTGESLLSSDQSRLFNERCYLAQSSLNRLLEIYETADSKKSDSALTAFVNELLGLNQLDALIEGTKTFGRLPKLRQLVPEYQVTEQSVEIFDKEIEKITIILTSKEKTYKETKDLLKSKLDETRTDLSNKIDNLEFIRNSISTGEDEIALQDLAEKRIQLNAFKNQIIELPPSPQNGVVEIEMERAAAERALQDWDDSTGKSFQQIANSMKKYFSDVEAMTNVSTEEVWLYLRDSTIRELERLKAAIDLNAINKEKRSGLESKIFRLEARSKLIDVQILDLSNHAEGLAKVLTQIMQHMSDDICPVCNRDFSEISQKPLSEQLSLRITSMHESASKLSSLSKEKSESTLSLAICKRDLENVIAKLIPEQELNGIKIKISDFEPALVQLKELEPGIRAGAAIRERISRNDQMMHAIQNTGQLTNLLKEKVSELSKSILGKAPTNLNNLITTVSELQEYVSTQELVLKKKVATLNDLAKIIERLVEDAAEIAIKKAEFQTLNSKRDNHKNVIKDADRIRNEIKEVSKYAQEVRSGIVREVFNDSLNTTWSDFFIRLAPEEPFVPAFAVPVNDGGKIEAILETRYRSGGIGGNPRTMLSAGNLNTAALTLFLALHFSIRSSLPWLIIDDPLQSMDEIHIAQFAALLRTISRQGGRQVILAVHEKSLFDYLAFELAPSSEKEKLHTLELARNARGESIPPNFKAISYKKDIQISG